MPRESASRRRSTGEEEDQYLLFVRNIPKPCRWQELKDIVREYCGQHVSKADTIPPDHEFGHVLITGRKNALRAYDEFCDKGWHGKPIQVSLRGPIQQGRVVSGDMLSSLRVVRPTHTYDDPPTPSPVQGSRGAAISYHSANPAYTIPNFQDLKQYSRPSHEISSPRSTAAPSMPMGRATQDRPREGDYWPTAVDPRRHERSTRGCLGPAPRPVTTSQAPPGPHYSTARHGTSQHVFRPMTSTRTAPISNCGQTVRLSNLPGAFSKRAVYQLLQGQGDVQVASCHSAPDKAGTSIAYATFTLASDARRAVEKLNGRSCENGRLAVAFVHSSSSTAPSKPVEESREKSFSSTTATQTTRGPLVVDGAKSTRPRYKGRHSPVDSDVSDDESHDLVSDSEDGTGSSGSDRRVAAVTRKVASMRVDRG